MTAQTEKICLLCANKNIQKIETINSKKIVSSWKKQLNIDAAALLRGHATVTLYHCPQCDLRFFLPKIIAPDLLYETLQQFDWYYQAEKKEYDYCVRFTKNKKILEVGCGEGFFEQHARAASYKGLEFNHQAVDACRSKNLNVEKTSLQEFSTSHRNEYDVVCAFQVLEHLANPKAFILSAIHCLKKGGYLLLSVPAEDGFVSLARENILNMPPHHLTRWSDKSLRSIAHQCKITVHEIRHDNLESIHYDWYATIMGQQIVKSWFSLSRQKLFDTKPSDILTSRIGNWLGMFLRTPLTRKEFLPKGHTVTAVFRT